MEFVVISTNGFGAKIQAERTFWNSYILTLGRFNEKSSDNLLCCPPLYDPRKTRSDKTRYKRTVNNLKSAFISEYKFRHEYTSTTQQYPLDNYFWSQLKTVNVVFKV